jgi:hypothetical protein
MLAPYGDDLLSMPLAFHILPRSRFVINLQPLGNDTNAFLGRLRPRGLGQLRTGWNQDFHSLLGHADVRLLFCHQYRGAAEPAHRDDESLLSINLGEWVFDWGCGTKDED